MIVSRELGIPCVPPGHACDAAHSGWLDRIVDGDAGTVTVIATP